MKTFWATFTLVLSIAFGCVVWGVAAGKTRWVILGAVLYAIAGCLAMLTDWAHDRYVAWRYTRWD